MLIEALRIVLMAYSGLWAVYVVTPPLLASVRRRNPIAVSATSGVAGTPDVVVLIPAHNMQSVIEACLDCIRASDYPSKRIRTIVIADHCTDDTAQCAIAAGATVLKRDVGPPGKTYALGWVFDELARLDIKADLFVITDATARIEPGLVRAFVAKHAVGEDIVIGHSLVDLRNQAWFAQCLGLALVHRAVQNRARERLKLSSLIVGCGMAYSRRYIEKYGWSLAMPTQDAGSHPTEDWRHGVRVVENGFRAAFSDDARVSTPLRTSLGAATQQGVRWERGRIANASTHGLRALATGWRRRDLRLVMAALDALQPPVAILGAACLALTVFTLLFPASTLGTVIGLAPLALLSVYAGVVILEGRREGISPATLLWAPVYVGWRTLAFANAWVSARLRIAR